MWCGKCYTSGSKINFHVAKPGEVIEESNEEDMGRFESWWGRKGVNPTDYRIGRDGDHLMNPFECDLCIFHKLNERDPS